jgi:hypothetical protein
MKKDQITFPLTKIFNSILKISSKTISLKPKVGAIGNMKYLPSFSKE